MKKFLGKKAVRLSFLIAAIAFLALYVVVLASPVALSSYTYKGEMLNKEYTQTMTFKGFNKVSIVTKTEDSETKSKNWIYVDGYHFIIGPETEEMTRKEFKQEIKEWKEDEKDYEARLEPYSVNAFRVKVNSSAGDLVYTNVGTIVFAAVGGVVELALIVFAALSLVLKKKA